MNCKALLLALLTPLAAFAANAARNTQKDSNPLAVQLLSAAVPYEPELPAWMQELGPRKRVEKKLKQIRDELFSDYSKKIARIEKEIKKTACGNDSKKMAAWDKDYRTIQDMLAQFDQTIDIYFGTPNYKQQKFLEYWQAMPPNKFSELFNKIVTTEFYTKALCAVPRTDRSTALLEANEQVMAVQQYFEVPPATILYTVEGPSAVETYPCKVAVTNMSLNSQAVIHWMGTFLAYYKKFEIRRRETCNKILLAFHKADEALLDQLKHMMTEAGCLYALVSPFVDDIQAVDQQTNRFFEPLGIIAVQIPLIKQRICEALRDQPCAPAAEKDLKSAAVTGDAAQPAAISRYAKPENQAALAEVRQAITEKYDKEFAQLEAKAVNDSERAAFEREKKEHTESCAHLASIWKQVISRKTPLATLKSLFNARGETFNADDYLHSEYNKMAQVLQACPNRDKASKILDLEGLLQTTNFIEPLISTVNSEHPAYSEIQPILNYFGVPNTPILIADYSENVEDADACAKWGTLLVRKSLLNDPSLLRSSIAQEILFPKRNNYVFGSPHDAYVPLICQQFCVAAASPYFVDLQKELSTMNPDDHYYLADLRTAFKDTKKLMDRTISAHHKKLRRQADQQTLSAVLTTVRNAIMNPTGKGKTRRQVLEFCRNELNELPKSLPEGIYAQCVNELNKIEQEITQLESQEQAS